MWISYVISNAKLTLSGKAQVNELCVANIKLKSSWKWAIQISYMNKLCKWTMQINYVNELCKVGIELESLCHWAMWMCYVNLILRWKALC